MAETKEVSSKEPRRERVRRRLTEILRRLLRRKASEKFHRRAPEKELRLLGEVDQALTKTLRQDVIDKDTGQRMLDEDEYLVRIDRPDRLVRLVADCHRSTSAMLRRIGLSGELSLLGMMTPYEVVLGDFQEPSTLYRYAVLNCAVLKSQELSLDVLPYQERIYTRPYEARWLQDREVVATSALLHADDTGLRVHYRRRPRGKGLGIYQEDIRTVTLPKEKVRLVVKKEAS